MQQEMIIELNETELDQVAGGNEGGSVTFGGSVTASGTTATVSGTTNISTTASSANLSFNFSSSST